MGTTLGWQTRLAEWVRARPYTLLTIVVLGALATRLWRTSTGDWEQVYVPAAQRLADGADVFGAGFTYPPINAWVALPFAALPPLPGRLLWFGVTVAALLVVAAGAWRLAGGSRLEGTPAAPRREHVIFILGLMCGGTYCLDSFTNQQNDLLVAALMILGCLALTRQREGWAGILLGVATGLKCTPLLWAPYLLWRRRWKSALLVPLVAVAINFIPDGTHPPAGGQPRLLEWGTRFLGPMTGRQHNLGAWFSAPDFNHSLAGVWNRVLLWEPPWQREGAAPALRADRTDPGTLRALGLGSMLFFVGAAVLCSWRARQRAAAPAPSADVLEFSLVLILMLLLSPQSSKPHFCTLLLPGFCLARAGLAWPRRLLLGMVVAAALGARASNRDLMSVAVYHRVTWYGTITLMAALLFAGCCLALLRRPEDAAESAQPAGEPARQAA